LPFPLAPLAIEIHGALLAAVQGQPDCAWTVTVALPPADAAEMAAGETENEQGAACSETLTFTPLTEMFALRAVTAALAATENGKLPLPCPLVEPESAIQDAPGVAVHVQSRSVVTVTVPLPPEGGKLEGVPAGVTWHRGGVGPATDVEVDPQATAARATAHSAASSIALRRGHADCEAGSTPEAQQAAGHDYRSAIVGDPDPEVRVSFRPRCFRHSI
jgi:hypothetical protein